MTNYEPITIIIYLCQVVLGLITILLMLYGLRKIQKVFPMIETVYTAKTRSNGQNGPIVSDALGSIMVTLATQIAGEDLNNGVMRIMTKGTYSPPIVSSGLVKSGPGYLLGFVINSVISGATLRILDGADNSGAAIFDTMTFTAMFNGPKVISLPAAVEFNNGCYFCVDGTISITPILS